MKKYDNLKQVLTYYISKQKELRKKPDDANSNLCKSMYTTLDNIFQQHLLSNANALGVYHTMSAFYNNNQPAQAPTRNMCNLI